MSIEPQALHRLTTVDEVEAIIGRAPAVVTMKELDHLDDGCKSILAHSPIAAVGYLTGADSRSVSTFIGGAANFAEVLNPNQISVPLPDDHTAPQPNSGISFVFFLPGVGEVLRLNGRVLRSDPVVVVNVEQAFVHCAKAIQRSRLWHTVESDDTEIDSTAEADRPRSLDDPLVADFFAASPFLAVSSWAADRSSDTSPRGDRPGFVQVLDAHTIAIPDRKGNKRADTFHNLVENDQISLAALVPGRSTVLHLSGTGYMSDDPDLLTTMQIKGVGPHGALVIHVNHLAFHTNTAILKSSLWQLASHIGDEMPDMMALASKHVVIMAGRSQQQSSVGAFYKLLAKYPRVVRALANLTYTSELKSEGYPGHNPAAEVGEPEAVRSSPRTGPWFRQLLSRLRPTARDDTSPRPGTGIDQREVDVVDVIRETGSATTLVLEDPTGAAFHFKAGQFFTLEATVGEITVRRAYSASCAPGGRQLAVTIKQVAGGSFSTHLNTRIKHGDRLQLLGPSGNFYISDPETAPKKLVLIAAGSGITPIMSILRTMMAETADSRVVLIYGNRTEQDIIFADSLAALCATHGDRLVVRHVLTNPSQAWTGPTGRLDQRILQSELSSLPSDPDAHFYVCGPEGLMDVAHGVLIDRGVAEHRIHQERFVRATDERDFAGFAPQTMVVESGGKRLGSVTVEPGTSLLQAGLAARLPMPYSCTIGNCGDCMVKLREGNVSIGEPNCLTPQQRAEGYILTCVGKPRSAVRIDIEEEE